MMQNCTCISTGKGSCIRIEGGGCNIKNSSLTASMPFGTICIAKGFTTEGCYIKAHEGKSIVIGEDCMFSAGINISTTDFHSIISKDSGLRINQAKDILIGKHVWLGRQVNVLKGASIPDNSIIGMGSTVSKPLEEYDSVYIGSPAKKVKSGVTWSRELR